MSKPTISILGLGAMGSAMTERLRDQGFTTTVWNRTAAKTEAHANAGSRAAATVAEAAAASDVIIVVLLDHASVREHLEPAAAELKGKVVVNVTTTTPNEARSTAAWAAEQGITYLDGAIMAVPEMIGQPGARLLYSGDEQAFTAAKPALETFGTADFEGEDAGLASLKDMALLTAMYQMFGGVFQAIAMMRTVGTPAGQTAKEVAAWLGAVLQVTDRYAPIIEAGGYDEGADQSVDFTRAAMTSIITASREQGVRADFLESIKKHLDDLSATGRGDVDWISVVEQLTIN
jgi:3-hydroxyisobutyrate dehydrogenase-like beta-hydroxyacid dehydrogenase